MSGSINEADRTPRHRVRSAFLLALAPLLIAAAAGLTVALTLDGVGERPALPQGPGLTLDEIFNIETGVYLWRSLVSEGFEIVTPEGARRVFGNPRYNPDHPPLGRLLIGAAHDIVVAIAPPADLGAPLSVTAARTAPAMAFAVTIVLVGWTASRWYGRVAGCVAAAALATMPRLFGHAHLAALETFIGLTFTATILATASRWKSSESVPSTSTLTPSDPHSLPFIPWRGVLLTGCLFGLTLLTKIQAVLLPIPIAFWALWQFRWRSVPMLLLFGLTGLAVFFACWPWLWLDPWDHLMAYLGRATDRPVLYCYYLGERYADRDVPWHYSWVMFAVTIPVGLHLLGGLGASRLRFRRSDVTQFDPQGALLGITILFVLTFFAVPGITVYDGTRLFLVVFPLWAVLAGKGAQWLWDGCATPRARRLAAAALIAILGSSAAGAWAVHPCQLSYYNSLVGGLAGANRLGFEPTYWRDSVTRDLLAEAAPKLPRGATLYLAPVLHPANLIDLQLLSPILREREVTLDAYDDRDPSKSEMRYVLVYRRHADPWAALEPAPESATLLAEVRRSGVQLAAVYDLGEPRLPSFSD